MIFFGFGSIMPRGASGSGMRIQVLIPDSLERAVGGVCEHTRQVFSRLPYAVDVIGIGGMPCEVDGINYVPIPDDAARFTSVGQIAPFLWQAGYALTAAKLPRPDIVVAGDWLVGYAACLLKQEYGVPLVTILHQGVSFIPQPPPPFGFIFHAARGAELSLLNTSDLIVHVSEASRSRYASFGPARVILNGVDISRFDKALPMRLPGDNPIKILYVGRVNETKNVLSLVRAKIPDGADLCLVGGREGSNPAIYQAVTRLARGSSVHMLGQLPRDAVASAMRGADIVVMPSLSEPFGLTALEALAAESLLVCSFADGLNEVLSEDAAIRTGTSPAEIESALARAVAIVRDEPDVLQRYKRNGRRLCEAFPWSGVAEQFQAVLKDVLLEEPKAVEWSWQLKG